MADIGDSGHKSVITHSHHEEKAAMIGKFARAALERAASSAVGILAATLMWADGAPSLVAVIAAAAVYATIWAAVGTVRAVRPLVPRR